MENEGFLDWTDCVLIRCLFLLVLEPFIVDFNHLYGEVFGVQSADSVVNMLASLVQLRDVVDRREVRYHLLRVLQSEMEKDLHCVQVLDN